MRSMYWFGVGQSVIVYDLIEEVSELIVVAYDAE